MSEMKQFVIDEARPLPVILLADISGSMTVDGKISALNESVREMVRTFADESDLRANIQVCIITFGGDARLHTPLQPAFQVQWQDMIADGMTPMGEAMRIAKQLIDDKKQIGSRAFRPTVVLVSDGMPNDPGWEEAMRLFIEEGRSSKAHRMALGIGADADEDMLRQFLRNPEQVIFHAEDAGEIRRFFKYVTISTVKRSQSSNPNAIPKIDVDASLSIDDF